MLGLNDLEINELYWTLFAHEIMGGQQQSRRERRRNSAGRRVGANYLDLGGADQQLGCVVPERSKLRI